MQYTAWKDFNTGVWDKAVDVRDFIQRNYIPYEGDDSFLAGPTERTTKLLPMRQDISTKTLKRLLVYKLTNH